MELLKFLKASLMLVLIGSSFAFSNAIVQQSTRYTEENKENVGLSSIEINEVVMWTTILFALGATVLLLVEIFAILNNLELSEFLDQLELSNPSVAIS